MNVTVNLDECLLYAGSLDVNGYGLVIVNRKLFKAHRVFYESEIGLIPDNMVCDHLCRVTQCINPKHIDIVTNKENILRGEAPSAINARKTHCIRGHEFTEANISRIRNNNRSCKACKRARNKIAYYACKQV